MNTLFASVIVAVLVAVVYCENCTTNDDCQSTTCSSGFHVICEHKQEDGVTAGGGLCTCAKDDLSCTGRQDCLDLTYNCISDNHKHCYDGKCICSRW